MAEQERERLQDFIARQPGTRFRARHRMRTSRKGGALRRYLIMGIGALFMLIGVILLVLPGPGILMLLIGAGLVAEESLLTARALDRIEVWVMRRVQRWRQWRERKTGA